MSEVPLYSILREAIAKVNSPEVHCQLMVVAHRSTPSAQKHRYFEKEGVDLPACDVDPAAPTAEATPYTPHPSQLAFKVLGTST